MAFKEMDSTASVDGVVLRSSSNPAYPARFRHGLNRGKQLQMMHGVGVGGVPLVPVVPSVVSDGGRTRVVMDRALRLFSTDLVWAQALLRWDVAGMVSEGVRGALAAGVAEVGATLPAMPVLGAGHVRARVSQDQPLQWGLGRAQTAAGLRGRLDEVPALRGAEVRGFAGWNQRVSEAGAASTSDEVVSRVAGVECFGDVPVLTRRGKGAVRLKGACGGMHVAASTLDAGGRRGKEASESRVHAMGLVEARGQILSWGGYARPGKPHEALQMAFNGHVGTPGVSVQCGVGALAQASTQARLQSGNDGDDDDLDGLGAAPASADGRGFVEAWPSLLSTVGFRVQLGMFRKSVLDYTSLRVRLDQIAGAGTSLDIPRRRRVTHPIPGSPQPGSPPGGAAALTSAAGGERPLFAYERGFGHAVVGPNGRVRTVSVEITQQLYKALRARADLQVGVDDAGKLSLLASKYSLDYSLGSIRAVSWYCPARGEGAIEMRLLDV